MLQQLLQPPEAQKSTYAYRYAVQTAAAAAALL
jgi:hypothetical protein